MHNLETKAVFNNYTFQGLPPFGHNYAAKVDLLIRVCGNGVTKFLHGADGKPALVQTLKAQKVVRSGPSTRRPESSICLPPSWVRRFRQIRDPLSFREHSSFSSSRRNSRPSWFNTA